MFSNQSNKTETASSNPMATQNQDLEELLLSKVREFIREIKSERFIHIVKLTANLEKDLGIDSLGRVELFLRIEKAFNVSLPQSLMAEADTVNDILQALKRAEPSQLPPVGEFVQQLGRSTLKLSDAKTLIEVLVKHANFDYNRPHIYLQNEYGEEKIIRYGELLSSAQRVAAGLLALGIKSQDTVAIMLPTCEEFFYAYFGILLAGAIPVPIYPPVRADKLEEYAVREASILNNAEVRVLITFSQVETLSKLLRIFIRSLRFVTTVPDLMLSTEKVPNLILSTEDPAMIQYTSGSTSDPKGVLLSHANLLANIRIVGKTIHLGSEDVGVSWLPLYHDMGLIGAWFSTLYHGFPLTLMSPLTFLTHPERWLWAIHYHRGTLSAGPNFAYELCVRKIKEEDIQGLDLSSWRLAFNGAEMINPETLRRFTKKFEPYGFRSTSFYPVYGLAECSVALSFPPLERGPHTDVIDRQIFESDQRAVPVTTSASATATANATISGLSAEKNNHLEFVGCGSALPEHEVRIVDENNQEVPERVIGSLQFTGPSAMRGYYRNPTATKAIYKEGWWDTGDFAYMADNEIFITGRKKDIIIKAGRNIFPQEIEEIASQVPGVRKGCVAAFGVQDAKWGTEKLVILAESNETKQKTRDKISREISENVAVILGIPPDQVLIVSPRTVPKTSSGKLQRSSAKKLYLAGKLKQRGLPVWMQMFKLLMVGFGLSVCRFFEKLGLFFYTVYMGLLLLLFVPIAWLSIMLFPQTQALWMTRALVKSFTVLTFCSVTVEGLEHLKAMGNQTAIYVCNHASYSDPLFLMRVLPASVLFVGKKELRTMPLVKSAIQKFGFLTVDRLDFTKNLEDTKTIAEAIGTGHSILIFPEGTFMYSPGLRTFKMGAFKLAVDTGVPIVPIAIQGTRSILQGHTWLVRPSKVKITFSKAIQPEAQDWNEVARLHTAARNAIIQQCGELPIDM